MSQEHEFGVSREVSVAGAKVKGSVVEHENKETMLRVRGCTDPVSHFKDPGFDKVRWEVTVTEAPEGSGEHRRDMIYLHFNKIIMLLC